MKKFLSISVLALSLIGLVSCNNGGGQNEDSVNKPTSDDKTSNTTPSIDKEENGKVKLAIKVSGPVEQHEFLDTWVKNFLDEYGYSQVTYTILDFAEDKVDSAVTDWTTGPDVYAYASDKISDLMTKGAISKVPNKYVQEMTTDMGETNLDAGKFGDIQYAYPYAGDNGYFLYYNKDLVPEDKVGTLDDLVSACVAQGVKFAYPASTAFYSFALLSSFGANYSVTLNDDQNAIASVTGTYDSNEGFLGAKAMQQIMSNPGISSGSKVGDLEMQKAPTKANGFGAVVDGSWNSAAYIQAVGADKLGMTKLPTITVNGQTVNMKSFLGYKLYGVNPLVASADNDEKVARLALDHSLANYLVSEKVQDARFDAFNTVPTNLTLAQTEKVKNNGVSKALSEQSAFAIPQAVTPSGVWSSPDDLFNGLHAGTIKTDDDLKAAMKAFNTKLETI